MNVIFAVNKLETCGRQTGPKEQFLRRRTAQKISESGLSCGCGDYALLFIDRIEARGFNTLLVDGAEISSASLAEHFSGHAIVAMRSQAAREGSSWWLGDSTNLKVLSRDWSSTEKSFRAFGCVFWIGYCGPKTGYPVLNENDLKAFYTKTLAGVPKDFLNHTLYHFIFTMDSSLRGKDGVLLNPQAANLQGRMSRGWFARQKVVLPTFSWACFSARWAYTTFMPRVTGWAFGKS